MTTMLPFVSVVIPTRDRPELLAEAIDAVVTQEYGGRVEVVVVVDGAQDLPALPRSTDTRTLQAIRNGRSPGLAGARNTGIEAASGDLVAFCDDDDRWLPQKLDHQVRAWRANPEAVLISSGIRVVNTPTATDASRLPPAPRLALEDLLRDRHAELHSSTFLMPRPALLGLLRAVGDDARGAHMAARSVPRVRDAASWLCPRCWSDRLRRRGGRGPPVGLAVGMP
jgi:glycosyltransferase involved in cell wall biosynthesis